MSERTFAGLTVAQLNALGREAGAEALASAHKAGLPSPGMTRLRFASGATISAVTLLHPDGTLEIKDNRVDIVAEHGASKTSELVDEAETGSYRVFKWSAKRPRGKAGLNAGRAVRKVKSA